MVRNAFRAAALLAALAAVTAAAGARAQTAGESGLGRVSFIDHSAVVRSAADSRCCRSGRRSATRAGGRVTARTRSNSPIPGSKPGRYIGLRRRPPSPG